MILAIACDTALLQINPIVEKAPKNANTFNFLAGTAKFIYLLLLEVVVWKKNYINDVIEENNVDTFHAHMHQA